MIQERGQGKPVQPHSRQAEEAVLGSILIDSESLHKVDFLEPKDFYIVRHQWIYNAMQKLRDRGMDVDYLTVAEQIERDGKLNELGGPTYIMALINQTPSSLNVESYARVVKARAADRRVLEIASQLAQLAMTEQDEKAKEISDAIDALARVNGQGGQAVHWEQYLSMIYDEVQAAIKNPVDVTGIPTGLPDWDATTGGLQLGTVTRLTGDPGLGKSVLAFQVAHYTSGHGNPAVYYSLEMSGRQVTRRKLAAETGILTRAMRSGKMTDEEVVKFVQGFEQQTRVPLYMTDNSHLTSQDLRVDLYQLKERAGIKVVVIDYEGLLKDDARDENDHSRLVSSRVHDIAKDLDLAILSIGDMTKQAIQGLIQGQGAMAGTGKELHNADDIMLMRKDAKVENQIVVTWEKLREPEGSNRIMFLTRKPGFPMFTNPPRI